ncbi:ATP-binding protein [Spirillospora sp. CA-294931]|uniref:ATP-binding protein n=1 Tax=Spirillospora sp. CA-294931 TaxID=3240042 RepID=UPI003D93F93D
MRSPVVEDEPTPAQAVHDDPRPEATIDGHPDRRAADSDSGSPAPPLLSAIIPGGIAAPRGHEITRRVAADSGSGPPIRTLDRLDDTATGADRGADDHHSTEPLELRALDRERAPGRPHARQIAGPRPVPFRDQVHRDRHIAPTGEQFAVPTVENTGDVLSPQRAATLTEPFQRGTERIHTDHAGVGLGLAIVQTITRAHQGRLTLLPRPTGGIRVTVELPTVPAHPGGWTAPHSTGTST